MFAKPVFHQRDLRVLEAFSIREVLKWIKDCRHSNVIVESENALVVWAIQSKAESFSVVGIIVLDCIEFQFALHNIGVELSTAHYLAREVGSLFGLHVWGSSLYYSSERALAS